MYKTTLNQLMADSEDPDQPASIGAVQIPSNELISLSKYRTFTCFEPFKVYGLQNGSDFCRSDSVPCL